MTAYIINFLRNFLIKRNIGRLHKIDESQILALLQKIRPKKQELNLIRIGSHYDGGYLIPNLIHEVDAVFSPGVANNSDFEMHFAEMGVSCYLADASVTTTPKNHSNFKFLRKFIGNSSDERYISLNSWIEMYNMNFNMGILQMDIEGNEYENLITVKQEVIRKFAILVIEFHDLYRLYQKDFFTLFSSTIERLKLDFEIVHTHANNAGRASNIFNRALPNVVEITFLRKDLFKGDGSFSLTPNPLDQPNRPDLPDLEMKFE
jgi:hypothetical protein